MKNSSWITKRIFICTLYILVGCTGICRVQLSLQRNSRVADFDEDLKEMYPDLCKKWFEWYKLFKTPAALPGQTCVYLATGAAKTVLSGRYFDCEQDIEYVVNQGRERLEQGDLYNLKVDFVGLSNDGGSAVADWEEGNRK